MKAVAYCTKCQTNWARLHSQDVGDERYEFCPLCKTDMDLTEGKGEASYLCSPITSLVINAETRQPRITEKIATAARLHEPTAVGPDKNLERVQLEDQAIAAYIESADSNAAEDKYFNTFKINTNNNANSHP